MCVYAADFYAHSVHAHSAHAAALARANTALPPAGAAAAHLLPEQHTSSRCSKRLPLGAPTACAAFR